MRNTIMLKVHNVILRITSAQETKGLCTYVHGELLDAARKYFNIHVGNGVSVERLTQTTCVQSQQIEDNSKKLQKHKVEPVNTYSLLRCIINKTYLLEHKIRLLQELGVRRVTAKHICMLPIYMRYNVETFQRVCKFPVHIDVVQNILNNMGCSLADLNGELRSKTDVTLGHIYKTCMSYHLSNNLGLPSEMFMRKVISHRKFRFYSFRMVKETLEILTNTLGFDVLQYPEALTAEPNNIHAMLNCLKEMRVSDLSPREVIHRYPAMLFLSAEDIRNNMNVLRSYGVNEEAILENLKIFKLVNKDELIQRLEILKKIPEIWIYKGHPLFLFVLVNIEKCLVKWEYIKTLREGEIPLHFLTRSRSYIRYVKCQIKKNMKYILQGELEEHTEKALARIIEHPNFEHVKHLVMYETVRYLKEQFPTELIARNGQILLYQRAVVAKALDIIQTEYSAENGYHFSPDHFLELVQYILEKSTGFSGDSVWYTEFPSEEYVPHLTPGYR